MLVGLFIGLFIQKRGYRRSPNLDNLKSNTMKNTLQR